jgi:hypothetical protein
MRNRFDQSYTKNFVLLIKFFCFKILDRVMKHYKVGMEVII